MLISWRQHTYRVVTEGQLLALCFYMAHAQWFYLAEQYEVAA